MNLDVPVSRADVILLGVEGRDMNAGREASAYSKMGKWANNPNEEKIFIVQCNNRCPANPTSQRNMLQMTRKHPYPISEDISLMCGELSH